MLRYVYFEENDLLPNMAVTEPNQSNYVFHLFSNRILHYAFIENMFLHRSIPTQLTDKLCFKKVVFIKPYCNKYLVLR